jgi:hypothetical protein
MRLFAGLFLGALPFLPFMLALLLAVVLITPSWRWVIGFIAVVSAYFAYWWIRYWLATLEPGYEEGLGLAINIVILRGAGQAWIIAVMLCIACMVWCHFRRSGHSPRRE